MPSHVNIGETNPQTERKHILRRPFLENEQVKNLKLFQVELQLDPFHCHHEAWFNSQVSNRHRFESYWNSGR